LLSLSLSFRRIEAPRSSLSPDRRVPIAERVANYAAKVKNLTDDLVRDDARRLSKNDEGKTIFRSPSVRRHLRPRVLAPSYEPARSTAPVAPLREEERRDDGLYTTLERTHLSMQYRKVRFAFKVSKSHAVRISPELSHFAAFFFDRRAKVSIVKGCTFLGFFPIEVIDRLVVSEKSTKFTNDGDRPLGERTRAASLPAYRRDVEKRHL